MGNFTTFKNGQLNEAVSRNAIKDFIEFCKDNNVITIDDITKYDDNFGKWWKYETGSYKYAPWLYDTTQAFLKQNQQYAETDLYEDLTKLRALYAKVWNNIGKELNLPEDTQIKDIDEYDDYTKRAIEKWLEDHNYESNKNGQVSSYWNTNDYGIGETWYRNLNYTQQISEDKKMNNYKLKGSNPERIAKSIEDFRKLLYRLNWCKNNWPEAVDAFKKVVYDKIITLKQSDIYIYINKIKAEEEKQRKFEEDVNNTDLSKYTPTDRDWEKMIDYMNRKSDPQRLADSCKDANKIVSRYIIASCLGWKSAANAFKQKALNMKYATDAELEAFYRKYTTDGIPEKWAGFVEAQKEDLKSGLNTIGTATGSIDIRIQKILDNCVNIEKYEYYEIPIPINDSKYHYNKIIKLTTINGDEKYLYCYIGDVKKYMPSPYRKYSIHYAAKFIIFNEEPTIEQYEKTLYSPKPGEEHLCETIQDLKLKLTQELSKL